MSEGHKHNFHGLWWHLGPYGRQDVHLHPCDGVSCEVELVGPGQECDGMSKSHVRKRLTSRSRWHDRRNEGQPLITAPRKQASKASASEGGS